MSPQDGSCQKLRSCVKICKSYAEKTVASFSPDTMYNHRLCHVTSIAADSLPIAHQSAKAIYRKRIRQCEWSNPWLHHAMNHGVGPQNTCHRPTRGVISSYNIAGLISEVSKEVATQSPKIAIVDNPTLIWSPRQEEPPRVSSTYTLYFQKLESLAYIFVAASMGLSSFKFVQWRLKTHLFCTRVGFGRSRSSKVDDFGTVPIESAYTTSY